jgi:hypothetical protein
MTTRSTLPKPQQLDMLDAAIVVAMGARTSGIMTYVIRNILAMEHGYARLETSTVLRRLKRMERAGEVERVATSYATMLCWRRKPA